MSDISYRCHHCGSTHEAESIRQNLYLDLRPLASYEPRRGLLERISRRRITQRVAQALWEQPRRDC